MKRIDVKITFRCNNRCKFCVQGEKRSLHADRPCEDIKEILARSRNDYDQVIFTGGEPTVRKDIIELVGYAKKLGYSIIIQSNGRMFFYESFCNEIISAGADIFAISIHGHNSKLHDYLTNVKGSFLQNTSGIKNLISRGKSVVSNTVINKKNYRFLPQIAELLINLGVRQYQFAFPHILGCALANKNWLMPRKKEIMPYVRKGLDLGIKKKLKPLTEAIPYCFLRGYEGCISEKFMPQTRVFDIIQVENFNAWRKFEGKSKGPQCKICKYDSCCEGPWREYPQIYGWSEFIPVK